MNRLLDAWQIELGDVTGNLEAIGSRADSFEYNMLATQALRLSQCIIELQQCMMETASSAVN